MENNNPYSSFSEDSNSNESSTTENELLENRRDRTKKDRCSAAECNGDKSSHEKNSEHSLDKDKTLRDEQIVIHPVQQALAFPAGYISSYNSTDRSYADNSCRTLSLMSCNMMATVNTPRPVNSYENMALNQHNAAVSQQAMPMASNLKMVQSTSKNIVSMGNYFQYGAVPAQENMFFPYNKEVVQLKNCVLYPPNPNLPSSTSVLYPPNPNLPPSTTRKRSHGCKAVFVNGLPDKITEQIIKEIFERCGTIESVQMSNKNLYLIRFSDERYAKNALYFSGYRLKIENKNEAPFTGELQVYYATRNDMYDHQCKKQALQCQARHQEQDCYRPPTPPVMHYTKHEAALVCKKIENEETFMEAASVLITWLKEGECTNENASSFYSMIQSTHNHMIKLQFNEVKYEDQLNEAKSTVKTQLKSIMHKYTEIEKIHKAASLQNCWNKFTKTQRKNIELLKKVTEEWKNELLEVINDASTGAEQIKEYEDDVHRYKEEIDSLRCQLEAVQNEKSAMQIDHQDELKRKDNEMTNIKQALQSSSNEKFNLAHKCAENKNEMKELQAFKRRIFVENPNANIERQARLIGLISSFLNVHPFGASIDYICSYLQQIDTSIRSRDIEDLLKRYPMIFKEDSIGIGASLEKKWMFTGFTFTF